MHLIIKGLQESMALHSLESTFTTLQDIVYKTCKPRQDRTEYKTGMTGQESKKDMHYMTEYRYSYKTSWIM